MDRREVSNSQARAKDRRSEGGGPGEKGSRTEETAGKDSGLDTAGHELDMIRRFIEEFDAEEINENENDVEVNDKGESREFVPPPF